MLHLEAKGSGERLAGVYASAVQATRKTHDDSLQVHLAFCEYTRRSVKAASQSAAAMRAVFESAVDKMHEFHPNSGECQLSLCLSKPPGSHVLLPVQLEICLRSF